MKESCKIMTKYVLIFCNDDNTVWKVHKYKTKKQYLKDVAYYLETFPQLMCIDENTFLFSDNAMVKRARKSKKIYVL